MNTKEIIEKAISLPVEERALVVDTLLRSLNQSETQIDQEWKSVVQRRLAEIKSGEVNAIPGEQVFEKIWKQLEK